MGGQLRPCESARMTVCTDWLRVTVWIGYMQADDVWIGAGLAETAAGVDAGCVGGGVEMARLAGTNRRSVVGAGLDVVEVFPVGWLLLGCVGVVWVGLFGML